MKEKYKKSKSPKTVVFISACMCLLLAGCDSLRFAPSEAQKQNAWLHNRTAIVTAETAKAENTSPSLQALTQLGEVQSRAFSSYCCQSSFRRPRPPRIFSPNRTSSLPAPLCRKVPSGRTRGRWLIRCWRWALESVGCWAASTAREPLVS